MLKKIMELRIVYWLNPVQWPWKVCVKKNYAAALTWPQSWALVGHLFRQHSQSNNQEHSGYSTQTKKKGFEKF